MRKVMSRAGIVLAMFGFVMLMHTGPVATNFEEVMGGDLGVRLIGLAAAILGLVIFGRLDKE